MPASPSQRTVLLVAIAGGIVLAPSMGLRQTYGLFLEPMTGDPTCPATVSGHPLHRGEL